MSQNRFLETQRKAKYRIEIKFMEKKHRNVQVLAYDNAGAINKALEELSAYDREDVISVKISYIGQKTD